MPSDPKHAHASEAEARDVAEAARQDTWEHPSFARELFLGRLRMDLVDPYPADKGSESPEAKAFMERLATFLKTRVDGERNDREEDVPADLLEGLAAIGGLAIKIPKEYGGLGLSQSVYNKAIEMVAAHCASLATLMSGHQSIGVPQPLKMFGTDEQKKRFMPRCAAGEISAFALTEPKAGSDPANMTTTAVPSEDGKHWIINGEKLWCTNGPIAKMMVVMARTPATEKRKRPITAFIVETDAPGVSLRHRSKFMGLRGIQNGVMRFDNVKIPRDNLLWKEGQGLKLALITLNIGRLTLPSCAVGSAKKSLEMAREWAGDRVQWGVNIGRHDEIAGIIADMAAKVYAMQAVADIAPRWVDEGGWDIRIEAALAKLFNTELGWAIANQCFDVRGGRGYETEESLRARGDTPLPVERNLRDQRIFTVVEGSSQIMHLFIAREALDAHVTAAGALLQPKAKFGAKLKAFWSATKFYAGWYPKLWFGWGRWPRFGEYGQLATHVRFLDRTARRLARSIFHCMLLHRAALERRQRLLGRVVDIGAELFAMASVISRARADARSGPIAGKPLLVADLFCRGARRRVAELFRGLRSHDDRRTYNFAQQVVAGDHTWLEAGILSREELERVAAETPVGSIAP